MCRVWKNGRSESSSRLFLAQTDRKLTISLRMIHSRTRELQMIINSALTAAMISQFDEDRVPVAQNFSDISSTIKKGHASYDSKINSAVETDREEMDVKLTTSEPCRVNGWEGDGYGWSLTGGGNGNRV